MTKDERKVFERVLGIFKTLEAAGVPKKRLDSMYKTVKTRVADGEKKYGGLVLPETKRDLNVEAGQEAADYIFYAAAEAEQDETHRLSLEAGIAMVATAWAGAQKGKA